MTFQTPNAAGYAFPAAPTTVINPNVPGLKPATLTLTPEEEKILAQSGNNQWHVSKEELCAAYCNHQPGQNGIDTLILDDSVDGKYSKFHCTRCGTSFVVDHRLTKDDVTKVCEMMHNIINTIKAYVSDEIPREFARDCFGIDAFLSKYPDLWEHANNSVRRKLNAMNNQYQQIPGYYGYTNPYATAYASGLTSPSAMAQYNSYMGVTNPMFNGNGQAMYGYGGQPMMGAPAPAYQQPQAFANPYVNMGGYAPTPVGGIMTADQNPLVAANASMGGQPAGTGYSVPYTAPVATQGQQMLSYGSVAQPAPAPAPTTSPVVTSQTTTSTPQLNIPTAPVPVPPGAPAPTAQPAPATPVGNTASISL